MVIISFGIQELNYYLEGAEMALQQKHFTISATILQTLYALSKQRTQATYLEGARHKYGIILINGAGIEEITHLSYSL
jgi:hypothetical protein